MHSRTQNEIVDRIKEIEDSGEDWIGTERGDLIGYLDFEHAKPYLKDDVTPDQWPDCTVKPPLDEIRGYMAFAIGKAEGERGISASRSLSHFRAWAWMLGDDEAVAFISADENYAPYGMPVLKYLCERFEVPFTSDERDVQEAESETSP